MIFIGAFPITDRTRTNSIGYAYVMLSNLVMKLLWKHVKFKPHSTNTLVAPKVLSPGHKNIHPILGNSVRKCEQKT